jgi:hypothetical protein
MLDAEVLQGTGKLSSHKQHCGSLGGANLLHPFPFRCLTHLNQLLHFGRGTLRPHEFMSPTLHFR